MIEAGLPLVSCVMITANRRRLCRRAVLCFQRQTYPQRELVVIDDGEQDLSELFTGLPPQQVTYCRIAKRAEATLGALRNLALEVAKGEVIAQWDDDDWYHPERLERQLTAILAGHDACCLSATLMHLNHRRFATRPYVGLLRNGVPGSIVHRLDPRARYPDRRIGEDTAFLRHWLDRRYARLPATDAHLFIRCFHGTNSWTRKHFLSRLRNSVPDLIAYVWHRHIRGDLFAHPRFRLSDIQKLTFESYLDESKRLGLL